MALVRAALERFTDVGVKSALQESAYSQTQATLKSANLINPYAIAAAPADTLEQLGILTNPFNISLHTHAAAKAIENKMLEIVGHCLPREPVNLLFLKKTKLNLLRRGPQHRDVFQNCHIEARDFARYDADTLVDGLCRIETRVAYMSDTLHFLEPEFILDAFHNNPTLDALYATMVLPVEAMHSHSTVHPDIYQINYNYGGFQYIPGGHGGGAYSHEFKDLNWLRYGHFRGKTRFKDTVVTCQLVESLGANHLFIFQRGDLKTPRVRTFHADSYVKFPRIFHPAHLNTTRPIKHRLAMQMFSYVKSVKEVTERDIYAKLRQLIKTDELDKFEPDEIVHMVNYYLFVGSLDGKNSYTKMVGASLWRRITAPVRNSITALYQAITGADPFKKLLQALQWENFTYSLEVVDYQEGQDLYWYQKPEDEGPWLVDERPRTDESDSETEEEASPTEEPVTESPTPKPTSSSVQNTPWALWANILTKHGFQGNRQITGPDGQTITPITSIQSLEKIDLPDDFPAYLATQLKELGRLPVRYTVDQGRACAFGSDVKNSRIGSLLRSQQADYKTSFAGACEFVDRQCLLTVIHGAGGSGKSQALQDWLRQEGKKFRGCVVVLPTIELRKDWEDKVVNLPRASFKTWEKALVQPAAKVVIFDDYGKLPAGYIDAYLATRPQVELAILTGDPNQSIYHESNAQAATATLTDNISHFSRFCRFHLNCTHRNVDTIATALGVYSENPKPAQITCSSSMKEGWPTLTPSLEKKACLQEMGRVSHTYAGCQGLTAPKIQVLLDTNTPLCSEKVLYTALSRAVNTIHFVNTGPNAAEFWDKLDATPYLKTFIDNAREKVATPEEDPASPDPTEPEAPITHFPVENEASVLGDFTDAIPEKHERELYSPATGHSNAVQTEDEIVQLFQHQQAKDETLLWATIDQRIATTTVEENEKEVVMKRDLGDILFENYKRAMKLPSDPIPFDERLWLNCKAEVQNAYLAKPIANLINGATRQDPDFDATAISLFLKSQWVKKTEKLGCIKIKPGQTIAAFMQETVMVYGTMARYMRRVRQTYQPRNIFINCEQSPEDLDQFVGENWNFFRTAHSNDFSAFDQSQDGAMLQFEVIKAKYHNIPEEIIDGYIHVKTHAKIFLGTIAIMRLSGEGPTFDANTECSIAYHHTKYTVDEDVAQIYAGDDMAQDAIPTEKPSFKAICDRLALTSKPIRHTQCPGNYATFCGWSITPGGIIKDPLKLYSSLELARRIGKTKEVGPSYAIDASYAYRKGDALHDLLTPEEARLHQLTIRKLHLMRNADVDMFLLGKRL
ncbi:MAG: polyprotein (methyl transferase, helicase, RdRP) [Plant associated potexvirus 1]|nr:MAG: polyprotein (methyl transferase, helicase, RdRP) [Plant associated potexvirus 1]